MLRDYVEPASSNADFATDIGRGESRYMKYDRKVCELSCNWLRDGAPVLNQS
jgi:choline-sulfatase